MSGIPTRPLRSTSAPLDLPVAAVGEQIVRVACAHDTSAGQRQGDAGSVDGDPATAPLLGNVGCGTRATSGVEYEDRRDRWSLGCSVAMTFVAFVWTT